MERNRLHVFTASSALLVSAWLIAGAYGHLAAVLPVTAGDGNRNGFTLLLPGLLLGFAAALNAALCKWLWDGRIQALNVAIVLNAALLIYLIYLLLRGVPGHPLASFSAIVATFLLLLVATRSGLVWPAEP